MRLRLFSPRSTTAVVVASRRNLMGRMRYLRYLVGALVFLGAAFTVPSTAFALGYGFGESDGTFNLGCPNNVCTADYDFFRVGLGGTGVKYIRFIVPYDTIETYNKNLGSCDYDFATSNSWLQLYDALTTAKAQGLTPMLSLTVGSATHDDSGNLLPAGEDTYPDPLHYLCGFEGLVEAVNSSSWNTGPVTDFEAYNEPENPKLNDGGVCASLAAEYWEEAQNIDKALGRSDNIVAGAFESGDDPLNGTNHPDCPHGSGDWYVQDYMQAIQSYGVAPAFWSWHPYSDVQAGYTGVYTNPMTSDLDKYINLAYSLEGWSFPRFWLTEAGVLLHGGIGADLVGNPIGQANAAEDFLNLQYAGNQAYKGQIGRAYYYELQTYDNNQNAWDSFDSAPIAADASGTSDSNPTNVAGLFRPSFCVLAASFTPAAAASSSACNNTVGFTQPGCNSPGPFGQPQSEIGEPPDIDWEDPCPTQDGATTAVGTIGSAATSPEVTQRPTVPGGDPYGGSPSVHRQLVAPPPPPPAAQAPPKPPPDHVARTPHLTCVGSLACLTGTPNASPGR